MACEVGLYYVLHITKQRNKNALLRLLPGLGECARRDAAVLPRRPLPSPQPAVPKSRHRLSQWARGLELPKPSDQGGSSPPRWRRGQFPREPCSAR